MDIDQAYWRPISTPLTKFDFVDLRFVAANIKLQNFDFVLFLSVSLHWGLSLASHNILYLLSWLVLC